MKIKSPIICSTFQVVLYFESIGKFEVCPTIEAYRTSRVANQKPASVLVYDYYDQVSLLSTHCITINNY